MKKALSICGLLAVVALPAEGGRPLTIMQTQSEAEEIRLSVRVYTEQQATRGRMQYIDHCSACHQAELKGSDLGPALKGDEFVLKLKGLTLQQVFERIATTMPGDAPGTLMPQVNADILAYVLEVNEFAAGQTELKPDPAALKAIAIQTKKP